MRLAGDPDGRESIADVLILCLQAEEQMLLVGTLNMVQIAARGVVNAYRRSVEYDEEKLRNERIKGIIDLYMRVEHYDMWQEEQQRRERESETTLDSLSADSMDEMLAKMQQLSRSLNAGGV